MQKAGVERLLLSLSKKSFGLFRQFFAVCCAHIVEVQKTMFHIPLGIFHLFLPSPLPIKRISLYGGPDFLANKFHTCSLRSVFVHVQKVNCPERAREATLGCAAAENDSDFIRRLCGELCEAFFDSLKAGVERLLLQSVEKVQRKLGFF